MCDDLGGFPRQTVRFLRELGTHNSKTWFDRHRSQYERYWLAPAKAFVIAMGAALATFSPDVRADPRINGSIFRINRDIRFSPDKTPYKDHLDLIFWLGDGPSRERPGYFFRLRPDRLLLGAGQHRFSPAVLDAYRTAVADPERGTELAGAVQSVETAGAVLGGRHYKRIPRGFDPEHDRAGLLMHNALHVGFETALPAELRSARCVELFAVRYRRLAPVAEWLARL